MCGLLVEVETTFKTDNIIYKSGESKMEARVSFNSWKSYEKPFISSHEACDELLQFHYSLCSGGGQ